MEQKNNRQDSPSSVPQNHSSSGKISRLLSSWRAWLMLLVLLAGLAIAAFIAHVQLLIPNTPSTEDLLEARAAQPSILLAADGTLLTTFSRVQQKRVDLAQMSPYVTQALIATEDHRFYEHDGIDVGRTIAAIFHTAGGDPQGGSTITQQLARNLFPDDIGRLRTLDRKLKEIITALNIERAYSKNQILETYLNTAPFLYNVVGIDMAARTYFDKPASQLDVLESATLIGMLKGTSYYNPIINPERAQKRRNVVLSQMVKRNMLSATAYQALQDKPLRVKLTRQPDLPSPAPHFVAHLRKWLTEWAEQNDYNLYTDGLIIHSTLDNALQRAATKAVERQANVLQDIADVEWGKRSPRLLSHAPSAYVGMRKNVEPFKYFWNEYPDLEQAFVRDTPEYRKAIAAGRSSAAALATLQSDANFMTRLRRAKTRLEAGFVAMDPSSGAIQAWVGSRDFERDQFDHVAQAERQPGSTFKPIVYGAALEQGLHPHRAYWDGPVEIRSADGSIWRPTDMSGVSGRPMSMREGLIYSKNSITAQVMQDAGISNIISLAEAVGINQSKLDAVPSLSLGTSPVTLLEMVTAYATIARTGQYREPVFIERITDRSGKLLAKFGTQSRRAMSEESAVELIDMMRGAVKQGTGQAVTTRFGIVADIAGKTGTTQNNTDGWFILMHPNLVAGTWVGFNDARVTMRSDYWGQGGHNALLVVGDFFRDALKSKLINVKAQFPRPKRMPLMTRADTPRKDWVHQRESTATQEQPAPGTGMIIRRDGTSVFIGDAQGDQMFGRHDNRTPSQTTDELDRIMSGMGRDPATGASLGGGNGLTVEVIPRQQQQEMSGYGSAGQSDMGTLESPESFR